MFENCSFFNLIVNVTVLYPDNVEIAELSLPHTTKKAKESTIHLFILPCAEHVIGIIEN